LKEGKDEEKMSEADYSNEYTSGANDDNSDFNLNDKLASIDKLHLAFKFIRDREATALAEAFRVNSTITEVGLGGNKIRESGAKALAEAFKVNSTITEVNLRSNYIGDTGATALAEALKVNVTIKRVHCYVEGMEIAHNLQQQFNINALLERISRRVLTFKYLLHQLSPYPSAIGTSEQRSETLPITKKRKLYQEEKERVTAEDINNDNDRDENRQRIKNKRSVLPVEFVELLSDYLTWEDFSKKNGVPIVINNRCLFGSCSLNSGITDFQYFCLQNDEVQSKEDLENVKMGYRKLKKKVGEVF